MSVVEVSREYGGRLLKLQTGKLAKQADASVLATYGETMVLVAVVSARKLGASQDFFPLTVDFHEKYYAAGRIPGGFFKREAKPSDKATLSARLIDRPIRPLFPEDYLFETNVTVTVLSIDGVNDPDYVASIAASAAIHMSDIPFNGPVGSCRVGMLDGKYVINFPPSEVENSKLDFLVSGIPSGVVMVEGSAKECSEKEMIDAIDHAHKEMRVIFEMQEELREKAGKPKRKYEAPPKDEALKEEIKKFSWSGFEKGFAIREKLARYEALDGVKKAVKEKFEVKEPKTDADKVRNKLVGVYLEELKATYARELTVNTKKRIDGRTYSDIRPITCEASLLPRVHGSALFTRGETQVLAAITLGTSDDEQKIDSISGTYQKRFMLHYNFPPFSVGEARPNRPPGRREIGHGFLAERALTAVLPDPEKFPYTIRLVSEVLESNGSSSMATVCSGSLAMMDAGIPTAKPVAGVAMGLIKEGEKIAVLSDILGDEDHLGDMDFKVCGTHDGITAFQMDLKIGGVSREIMEQALEQAREGRVHILGKMAELMDKPRENFSPYAPRIFTIKVKPDKVREVIGSGGKVIRSIIERTGVKIDIEDDGRIHIASTDEAAANKAIEIINEICAEAEPGKIYEGPVTKIMDFGAFIEIFPGTEGLCHISELEHFRVRYVDDVVKVGDTVKVKCLEVDPSGKIRLSRKALIEKTDAPPPEGGGDEGGGGGRGPRDDRPPRDDRGGDRDRGPRGGGGGRFGGGGDRGGRGGSSGGGRDRDRGPRGGGGGRSMGGGGFGGDRDRGPDRGPAPVRERDRDRGPGPGPDRGERPGNRMPRRDEAPRSLDRDDRPPREDFRDREDRGYFPKDDREPRAETSRDDDDRFNRRDDE